jgi:DNA-binding transcriptional LysR family regulator
MRLDNFDLNLLVAFDALLEERAVTRAAQRLNVTQSAMSASLKRLRETFQDPILAQHGKRMVPTPFAMTLEPEVRIKLSELRAIIARKAVFEPSQAERSFRIAASDYITTVLLAPLLNSFNTIAPAITFNIDLSSPETMNKLANGQLDLFLTPQAFVHSDHPCELVFEEHHVVVGWNENPAMQQEMTSELFLELGHVAVNISGGDTFAERSLREQGIDRRIEIRAPSFIQAPFLIPGTMRLCVMHERLATLMAKRLPLVQKTMPFPIPPMREMMQYHATREADPGLLWLRDRIRSLASSM